MLFPQNLLPSVHWFNNSVSINHTYVDPLPQTNVLRSLFEMLLELTKFAKVKFTQNIGQYMS